MPLPSGSLRPASCGLLLALLAVPPAAANAGQSPARALAPAHPVPATAQEVPAGPSLDLAAAIQIVLERNPLARAARLDVERAELDVEQLEKIKYLPRIAFSANTGLVPAARGDVFSSPDDADAIVALGPFYQTDVSLVAPLYTFGRLGHARAAARGVRDAQSSNADNTRAVLVREVVRVYWGLVAAKEALEIATEMRDRYYEELLPEAEEKLETSDIDQNDAYEMRAARFEIDRSYLDALEARDLAHRALSELVGREPGVLQELDPPEVTLTRAHLESLERLAERQNPQLNALRSVVLAQEESMGFENSERLPMILLGGGFGYARAPNRADQSNPFVYDPFNYVRLAAAVNVRWDLNFAQHRLDYLKRQAERDATQARLEALDMKVSLDVYQALERVLKNRELVISARETARTARRWLRTAADDWDLGLGEAQPLIKAYAAFYRLQAQSIETQYLLNTSLAELSLVLGDFHTYLQWVADGQAALD